MWKVYTASPVNSGPTSLIFHALAERQPLTFSSCSSSVRRPYRRNKCDVDCRIDEPSLSGRTTQKTVCYPLYSTTGSLRLCVVTTHNNSFNGFGRRSAATALRKGIFVCFGSNLSASLCKLCPVERVLQKCGVVGLTCTSLFFRVNNSVPN